MDLLSDVWETPKIAKKSVRVGAAITDALIIFIVGCVIGYFWGTPLEDGSIGFHLEGWPAIVWFATIFVLMPLQEGFTGKTIGKRVAKIKVVKEDYSDCTTANAIVRHLLDAVDMAFF